MEQEKKEAKIVLQEKKKEISTSTCKLQVHDTFQQTLPNLNTADS